MDLGLLHTLMRRVVDDLPDAILLVEGIPSDGVSRRIIFVNRAFTVMTGFTAEEAIGRTPDITVGPDTDREALSKIQRARDANEHARVEILKYRKDGSTFWAEMDLTPVFDDGRTLTHYCAHLRDMTQRRSAQLRRAETERLAAIGTLAAGVAHEMNNPLAYALMNLSFVEEELPLLIAEAHDPLARRWAELTNTLTEVTHGVSRVAQIVRDIRSFSRLDTPAVICRVPVLVERAVQMARAGMPDCARIATHYDETAEVCADAGRLSQVFLSLVLNALEATPTHDGTSRCVEIRAFNEGDTVVIEVKDEGVGIAPEILPRVFDPFFTTKEPGKGTGLGLSISYGIVRSAGGTMTIESKRGCGTKARVVLPAASSSAVRAKAPVPDRLENAALRLRVLVVDDEPMIGRALKRSLSERDDIVVCQSGADALDLLAASREYHLILCDLSMPGMSGAKLCEQIGERWPEMIRRVVIMTGGAVTDSTRNFLEQSKVPRLDKPLDLTALRRILDDVRATYPQLPA
jgi:PAS domain S-box-containing protein